MKLTDQLVQLGFDHNMLSKLETKAKKGGYWKSARDFVALLGEYSTLTEKQLNWVIRISNDLMGENHYHA